MRKLALLVALVGLAAAPAPAHAGIVQKLIDAPVRKIFDKIAAKKQDRVFHAAGVVYKATIERNGKVQPAIVRLSRGGAGKPGKPDILGVAIKTKGDSGRDQDFLMVTARGTTGLMSHVPKFGSEFAGQTVSSLTKFKAAGIKGSITTVLPKGFKTPLDLDAPGVGASRQSFSLMISQGGILRPFKSAKLGKVTVNFDQPLSGDQIAGLRMTPWHDGAGIEPVGLINRLRKPAYIGSQEGRGLADEKR